jgi:hypothetical protein
VLVGVVDLAVLVVMPLVELVEMVVTEQRILSLEHQ